MVEGLGYDDARALLESVIAGPLDDRVRDRIIAETAGNPLALLELPRGRNPAELAGGFGLPDPAPLSARIEQSFARRVERMPAATQRLLLIAAAEPIGDPALLFEAADRLGLNGHEALADAEELITVDDRVRFRHPLVRSAVYRLRLGGGPPAGPCRARRRPSRRATTTIGAHGTAPTPPQGPTRPSRPSWRPRPAARRLAAALPRRRRSSSAPSR